MNMNPFSTTANWEVVAASRGSAGYDSGTNESCGTEMAEDVSAAQTRLARATERHRQQRTLTNHHYYGHAQRPEEIILGFSSADLFDAKVTRNHYGSLVLNATRALFIDVDVVEPGRLSRAVNVFRGRRRGPWRRTLDDLRTVLTSEREEGFRIYRTAAGFRVLATIHEFAPASEQSQRLMKAAGADTAFTYLCRIQNSFRARLTPKPWRCGAPQPPNCFPRSSSDEQRCFADWVAEYELACRDHATCQFLEHVGSEEAHQRIQSIVEVHDRETKAFESLPLA